MPTRFTLNVLGTASAKPRLNRWSSAQMLQASERLFLIDCAEGTQRAVREQQQRLVKWCAQTSAQGIRRLSLSQLDAIFISHIHGDHIFGLFPLLSTMAMNGRSKPLKIFGPNALGPVLSFYKSYWGDKDPFSLEFTPLKMHGKETVLDYGDLTVEAFPLNHAIESFGFLFRDRFGRSYAYCSDTAPFEQLHQWVKGVDILYHEATYPAVDFRKAVARFHSTTEDAARCALNAGAGRLVVAHYSSAVREDEIHGPFIAEVRRIFPNSCAADDGDIFDIPVREM